VKCVYDAVGNLLEERVESHVITSEYDEVGNRRQRRSGFGDEVVYNVDGRGMLLEMSVHQPKEAPRTTTLSRNALGFEVTRQLPGGMTCEWTRGTGGQAKVRSVKHRGAEITSTKYDWRPNGTLGATLDPFQGRTTYEHDARSYLVGASLSDGASQFRAADATGNVYGTRERTDRSYNAAGAPLRAVDVRFAYDDEGQLVEKRLPDGNKWRYAWDGAGQLVRVTRPDGIDVVFCVRCARATHSQDDGRTRDDVCVGS
jgi:YD repeat-containing protein